MPVRYRRKWNKTENVIWRVDLPGPAGSTPVIWGNRSFDDGGRRRSIAVDLLFHRWKKELGAGCQQRKPQCTPRRRQFSFTVAQYRWEHVWVMMCDGTLSCYTVKGKKVWTKDLQKDYGRFSIQFGMTSTPVLDKGVLYLQLIHGRMRDRTSTSKGWVIALDAESGQGEVEAPS